MATKGTGAGVIANMVTSPLTRDPVARGNEICYISTGGDKLMAEVIGGVGANVAVQVSKAPVTGRWC